MDHYFIKPSFEVVSVVRVIQSNTFNDGTTIATVADMSNMIFRGKVDETEVGRIHEGMPIKLTVGAMESRTFDAELEYVAPKGVEENGAVLFEVKAAVHMPGDAFIRAGYSANAEIVLKRAENVLSVPESCVEFSGSSYSGNTGSVRTRKQK